MKKNTFYGSKEFVATELLKIPEYYQKENIDDQIDVIRKSIKNYGVKSPIIVNESSDRFNTIINGVLIYQLALELKIEELPVYYLDLTIQEEKQLSILLNQKAKALPSKDEIIDLIGKLSYEDYFNPQENGDILKKHLSIKKLNNGVSDSQTQDKKLIKQLIFKVSGNDKEKFSQICKELGVKNQTQALLILMELYLGNK